MECFRGIHFSTQIDQRVKIVAFFFLINRGAENLTGTCELVLQVSVIAS